MTRPPIPPQSDKALNCYHQKLSWKISEEDWDSGEIIYPQLETKIPGSSSNVELPGGCVRFSRLRKSIQFLAQWPTDVDQDEINIVAFFSIKFVDGSSARIEGDRIKMSKQGDWKVSNLKKVKLEPIYDSEGCFTFEAELMVSQEGYKYEKNPKKSDFVKDIEGIFSDVKTADLDVIAGNERFHCHKNILSARCEVFKNMLAPNTLESESNTILVKEAPAEAVESMLKYIYSGETPEDPEKLTFDLLNLAEMYLLGCLKEACLKSLIESLEVSSCISTFIMADRYLPSGRTLKEKVIEFMKCKAGEVVDLEDWSKLLENHPALANEVIKAIAKGSKEKHKCQFCV